MSLRMRLSLAFVFVVLAPLLIAAVLVARGVPKSGDDVASLRAEAAASGAAALLSRECAASQQMAQSVAWESRAATPRRAVRDAVSDGASYAALLRPSGSVVAQAGRLPTPAAQQVAQSSPTVLGSCERGAGASPYISVARVPVVSDGGGTAGAVVVARPLGSGLLNALSSAAGGDVTLVDGGTVIASTLPADEAADAAAHAARIVSAGHPLRIGDFVYDAVGPGPGRSVTVMVRSVRGSDSSGLAQELIAVVVAALVLAVAIGWLLARMTTRPLVELASAAGRVAEGDLETRIPIQSGDEVGQLAVAFNEMTDRLRAYIQALRGSRDELRRNLARLGDTLSGTHDLNRILAVIVDTATTSVRASGAVLLMSSAGRGDLFVKVARGVDGFSVGDRVRLGEGVLGVVGGSGEPVRGWADAAGHLLPADAPHDGEGHSVLAVPLRRSGRVLGVLALYDRVDAPTFDGSDLETIRSFSAQATVAIDNVLLHQEAQRLSITDGLTGLWNFRYFTMNFAKEIERAARFHRPLALLVLDLDKFKDVNDAHGHQRGDSVLIELATRVSAEIREVDTFARYGGEEFVLVLPETDASGAAKAAERVCEVVRHRAFGHHDEEPLRITVSVGVAVFPGHGTTAADLVRSADAALYAAKEAGRNGWRMAGELEVAGRGE
jgi:two-component system, cell cycle response regulator